MPTAAERRALLFTAAVAFLGVVARIVQARDARPAPTEASVRALDAQIARVDSVRKAGRSPSARSTTKPTARPSPAPPRPRPPVDLDVADRAAIEGLPWIGPALAARIVEDRDRCGPFGSLDGLTRVNGIGPATTRRLEPYVTFSGRSRPNTEAVGSGCPTTATGATPRRRGRS